MKLMYCTIFRANNQTYRGVARRALGAGESLAEMKERGERQLAALLRDGMALRRRETALPDVAAMPVSDAATAPAYRPWCRFFGPPIRPRGSF